MAILKKIYKKDYICYQYIIFIILGFKLFFYKSIVYRIKCFYIDLYLNRFFLMVKKK